MLAPSFMKPRVGMAGVIRVRQLYAWQLACCIHLCDRVRWARHNVGGSDADPSNGTRGSRHFRSVRDLRYAGYRLGLSASAPEPKTTVKFAVMPNACDAHVHVIGDTSEFPMSPDRDSPPPKRPPTN